MHSPCPKQSGSNCPGPCTYNNLQELQSFLGLLNYYGKFIPNLSTIIHPINELLQADRKQKWSVELAEAFELAKMQLTFSQLLTHYDPSIPIQTAADVSAYMYILRRNRKAHRIHILHLDSK